MILQQIQENYKDQKEDNIFLEKPEGLHGYLLKIHAIFLIKS